MLLNLGCSDRHIEGYLSVDIVPPADIVTDLSQLWPWPDSSVDEVVANDIIEHIADRIHFMNELHRVLKPGARANIEVPDATRGSGFVQDPTHRSQWCMNSFQYFEHGSFAHNRLARSYGITAAFKVVAMTDHRYAEAYGDVWKISVTLEAVK